MSLRKQLSAFLLLLMLSMQFALAQHAGAHFLENKNFHASHEKKSDHNDQALQKICETCIIAKHFSDGYLSHNDYANSVEFISLAYEHTPETVSISGFIRAYDARGPPTLLS